MSLIDEIDFLLAYLEDTAHGEEGRRISEMRKKLMNMNNLGCQCDTRHGETTVWCCNECGLPCENNWLPTKNPLK